MSHYFPPTANNFSWVGIGFIENRLQETQPNQIFSSNALIAPLIFCGCCSDAALNVFMDVRKMDRKASLASVAGEVEMEEEGDGARLFQSEASASTVCVFARATACEEMLVYTRREQRRIE